MPRKKKVVPETAPDINEPRVLRKRPSREATKSAESTTSKRRRSAEAEEVGVLESIVVMEDGGNETNDVVMQDLDLPPQIETESEAQPEPEPEPEPELAPEPVKAAPRRRGRPPKNKAIGETPTKPALTPIAETPVKTPGITAFTPGRAADRSARKKSARALIDQVVGDGISDDEQVDDHLAREIYESSDAEDEAEDDERTDGEGARSGPDEAATPSKTPRGRRKGGRPKKARSPTPPRDLPPHELYFAHNKPGRPKTSDNTLSYLSLLTHDEYFDVLREHQDRHTSDIEYLESLHTESFPQWVFELSQGFRGPNKIVMVNGYAHTTTIREILSVIGSAIDPSQRIPTSQPTTMVQNIASHLAATSLTLTIIINSIDASPLRKITSQAVLAQLAAHPQVNLVCTADTPDFPLLWDIGVRSAFNFVFHDCTTFAQFRAELDVVDEVHELLGRQAQRVNGREGVAFVLKSLTENAKNLFRLLVGEVLIAMEEDAGGEDGVGLEYRMVYNKAVEEFICSSEMAFRTLLKEFHDHQMITSRKDALGTELLSLPFRKEDLEAILEDLSV
ncbi:Origin recognition complex subunit 2 [Cladobotryum mycophilum]|uniref:Origin recognition complex subunit 2 n=1 Tax=Cladobotryum mycophilum TaxID=491253 RepID=A0ABR0SN61_9HYPO